MYLQSRGLQEAVCGYHCQIVTVVYSTHIPAVSEGALPLTESIALLDDYIVAIVTQYKDNAVRDTFVTLVLCLSQCSETRGSRTRHPDRSNVALQLSAPTLTTHIEFFTIPTALPPDGLISFERENIIFLLAPYI